MQIGRTDPDTTLRTCSTEAYMKILSFSFLFTMGLAEKSAKTKKRQLFHSIFVYKSSFPFNVKLGEDIAEDETSMQIPLPNSPPIKIYDQTFIAYMSQVLLYGMEGRPIPPQKLIGPFSYCLDGVSNSG